LIYDAPFEDRVILSSFAKTNDNLRELYPPLRIVKKETWQSGCPHPSASPAKVRNEVATD
jgi:hypothetical protein